MVLYKRIHTSVPTQQQPHYKYVGEMASVVHWLDEGRRVGTREGRTGAIVHCPSARRGGIAEWSRKEWGGERGGSVKAVAAASSQQSKSGVECSLSLASCCCCCCCYFFRRYHHRRRFSLSAANSSQLRTIFISRCVRVSPLLSCQLS